MSMKNCGWLDGRHLAISVLLLVLYACADGEVEKGRPSMEEFTVHFKWAERISLEEDEFSITVSPNVRYDPTGGFLVADEAEDQIRRYSSSGELEWGMGRRGDGPGEFRTPTCAIRLQTGHVLAVNHRLRSTVISEDGSKVTQTFQTPPGGLFDIDALQDGESVLYGMRYRRDGVEGLLQVVTPRNGEVTNRFFSPEIPPELKSPARMVGWAVSDLRGDTAATVFSPVDTIFLFDVTTGRQLARIPLNAPSFRPWKPLPRDSQGRTTLARWSKDVSLVNEIVWLPNGHFLVQYFESENNVARFRLLLLGRHGEFRWELLDTPRLLAASRNGESFAFLDPEFDLANRWRIARLKEK